MKPVIKTVLLSCALLIASSTALPVPHRAHSAETTDQKTTIHCGTFVFNNLYEPSADANAPPKGFFADVMRGASARLGINVKFSEIGSFATGFEELKSGRFDMLCATLESHAVNYDKMLFSTALFYDPVYVYGDAKRDYAEIKTLGDINQPKWRIAGMDGELGGYYGPIVFPKAIMHMVGQMSAVGNIMTDMFSGKADMVMLTKAAADAYQKTNPETLKQIITEPIAMYPVRFVFKPDDIKMKLMFDSVFEDMRAEGVIDRIKKENGIE